AKFCQNAHLAFRLYLIKVAFPTLRTIKLHFLNENLILQKAHYTKTARLLSVLFFSEIANISYIIV
ncbi:hypothetical protein, partial [Brevibacillus agri]|uniref:hypothetical protein n=1 Tax=Brevibacillus agri TaxID=51101 RepID=UPI002E1D506B|nr:hypothetical protein [Brevibacillus agri]